MRWPGPFRAPRTRLRSGTLGSVPPTVALVAWLFGMAGWAPIGTVVTAIGLALLASLAWLILQGIQLTRSQVVARCRAWDERGRALRIEPL